LKIVVVGMGYVGIPSAVLFADVPGITVTGVQRRSSRSGWKIEYLNEGKCPIEGEEPGLEELIKKVVEEEQFYVTDDTSVYGEADVILIDVQTPVDVDHNPRYESLKSVSSEIGEKMKKGVMVGLESTVAPGTTKYIVKPILEEASDLKAGLDFNLIFSYERVMVGRLLHNLQYMPRIVGEITPGCAERGAELYMKITKTDVYTTDCMTAEISKTVENAYRDVNIAFANEVAFICESLGANVHEVRRFVNSLPHDPSEPAKNPYRMMMKPGAGVGGHCLPKDSWLLKYGADTYGTNRVNPEIIIQSRKTNDYMPEHMKNLIALALEKHQKDLAEAKITLLGYAFLENSDDTRNTPARPLYESLIKEAQVVVHDPYVRDFDGANNTRNLEEALRDSDCLALVTAHKEYNNIKFDWLKDIMRTSVIVDGRNMFNSLEARNNGFTFLGVGISHQ
jgi:UDP-N-acetyl-D-mannosaminuronic acid dehydrogenase